MNYEIIRQIGKGAFGTAYKAIRKSDNKIIALKIIPITPTTTPTMLATLDDEINALKQISEPTCGNIFVVCYYGSYKTDTQYLIEMEYIEGIDMFQFVKNPDLTKDYYYYYLLLIARDVSLGLQYVHEKGVIHNDIKLENIMIELSTYTPKIIDFGLACLTKTGECMKVAGTLSYMTPEFIKEEGAKSTASDMWCLGIALYAAVMKRFPFPSYKIYEQLKNEILYHPVSNIDRNVLNGDLLNTIIQGLLRKDVVSRYTAAEVVAFIDQGVRNPMLISSSESSESTESSSSKQSGSTSTSKSRSVTPDNKEDSREGYITVSSSSEGYVTPDPFKITSSLK